MKLRRIKVIYTKLGRSKAHGLATNPIQVDERLRGIKQLEIIIHEANHILLDKQLSAIFGEDNKGEEALEDFISRVSATMARTLWHEKYRKVDDHNKDKLQDE